MSFFLRYVLFYLLGAVALIAASGYLAYDAGFGAVTWVVIAATGAWLLGYVPVMLWRDYRRVTRLIADLRAGRFGQRIDPDHVRESVEELVTDYAGVPGLVAAWLVPRVLTDEVVRQLAARLDRSGQSTRS